MRLLLSVFALLLVLPGVAHALCGMPDGAASRPPPFSPELLVKTYDCLRAGYEPAKNPNYDRDLVQPMMDAGANFLIGDDLGLRESERAHILNDFGFWLLKAGNIEYAIEVLRTVVWLEPQRALAWLNLGDAYAGALTSKGFASCCVVADLPSLASQASAAYYRYVALTPRPATHAVTFLSQHPYDPENEAVCRFIADQANAGNLSKLFLPPGSAIHLPGNGQTYYLYMVTVSAGGPKSFMVYSTPQQQPGVAAGTLVDISPFNAWDPVEGQWPELQAIPYAGSIAVLTISYHGNGTEWEAIRAVLPGRHVVCDVDQTVTPPLATGPQTKLCNVFRKGRYFEQPGFDSSQAGQHIVLATGQGGDYILAATSRADLRNDGHKLDVAFFSYSNLTDQLTPSALYCHKSGVVVYNPGTKTAPVSELNGKLENLPPFCPQSADTLILWQGKTYIETGIPGHMVVPGAGIYVVKDDDIVPVCLIGTVSSYNAD